MELKHGCRCFYYHAILPCSIYISRIAVTNSASLLSLSNTILFNIEPYADLITVIFLFSTKNWNNMTHIWDVWFISFPLILRRKKWLQNIFLFSIDAYIRYFNCIFYDLQCIFTQLRISVSSLAHFEIICNFFPRCLSVQWWKSSPLTTLGVANQYKAEGFS